VKVLIADDDQLITGMLGELLGELGHVALVARDGSAAVTLCDREKPDLVILDFLMPRLSGLDALVQIRNRHRVPAILLTAIHHGSLRGVDGMEHVQAMLEKPFDRASVVRAIEKALARR
jgi:DNA-binding response OmpR family regulator